MVNKILKESADGRRVIQVAMDIEVPRDFSKSDLRGWESGSPGKIYMAIGSALDKVGGAMAGDYIEMISDNTDVYENNGYFDESLKESFDDKVTIEDGANQLLSDLFDKLGVDPQAASQFSRWDEVVDWISSVVMQLKDIKEESIKESKEELKYLPKTSTQIARNVIELAVQKFGGKMIRVKSKTSNSTSYAYKADDENQLAKAKEFIDSKIKLPDKDESVKEECDKSLKESDEVVKNYTIEYTYGDGDHNDVDIKATSFGNLMDKFWSGEYGNSDEIEILSVYDEDGVEYDVGTGEEIW